MIVICGHVIDTCIHISGYDNLFGIDCTYIHTYMHIYINSCFSIMLQVSAY